MLSVKDAFYEKHCPGCFQDKSGLAVCAVCGYDESVPRSPLYLPHGEVLADQYRIGRVLGKPGGFGITYLGWDVNLQQRVAIKEYLPRDIASRRPDTLDVQCDAGHDQAGYEYGREQFLREARTVARLSHPHVVRVRGFCKGHNTAYLVMDYYEGTSLGEFITKTPCIEARLAVPMLLPVLAGLDYVHRQGVVHRDVKPHNIYIAAEVERLILLDFGAARQATGDHVKSMSVVLTEGYAPLEQYQRRAAQGPWTDVYGLAATLYRVITGQTPPAALDRMGHDPLWQQPQPALPAALRPILERALAVQPEARYPSAAEFHAALSAVPAQALVPSTAPGRSAARVAPSAITQPGAVSAGSPVAPDAITRPRAPDAGLAAVHEVLTGPLPAVVRPPVRPAAMPAPARLAASPAPAVAQALPFRPLLVTAGVGTMALAAFYLNISLRPEETRRVYRSDAVMQTGPASGGSVQAPRMVSIPAGQLRMGDEAGRPNEQPVHALPVGAFKLGAQEVTVAQFGQFVRQAAYQNPDWAQSPCRSADGSAQDWQSPGYAQDSDSPVVCVSWQDARAYAQWLSAQTGARYRLPTESEWEYAARAGTRSAAWWGDGPPPRGQARCAGCAPATAQPQAAGSTPANGFGIHDSSGNVREWTCSVYGTYGQGAEMVCGMPRGDAQISVRGGSWREPAEHLRSARREGLEPGRRDNWTGFRLARD